MSDYNDPRSGHLPSLDEGKAAGRVRVERDGDVQRTIVNGYFTSTDLGGAVVIPSAANRLRTSGKNIMGFDPDAPQVVLIDPVEPGYRPEKVSTTRGIVPEVPPPRPSQPAVGPSSTTPLPQPVLQYENPNALSQDPATAGSAWSSTPTSSEVPMSAPFAAPPPVTAPRAVLSTHPQAPSEVNPGIPGIQSRTKPPAIKVLFHIQGMILPVMYHEVTFCKGHIGLVLIYDHGYKNGTPPPEFLPNDEDKPFKIELGPYVMTCNYYGQTYVDELEREHTIFSVDRALSYDKTKEPENAHGQQNQLP